MGTALLECARARQKGHRPARLMRISIVVPVYGKAELTARFLHLLRPLVFLATYIDCSREIILRYVTRGASRRSRVRACLFGSLCSSNSTASIRRSRTGLRTSIFAYAPAQAALRCITAQIAPSYTSRLLRAARASPH